MALHRTIDPQKALRWERSRIAKSLLGQAVLAVVVIAAAYAVRTAVVNWDSERIPLTGTMVEAAGADGMAAVRYRDPAGTEHIKRLKVDQKLSGSVVKLEIRHGAYDEPRSEGMWVYTAVLAVPWVILAGSLLPLAAAFRRAGQLGRVRRAKRVLESGRSFPGLFDWYRKGDGRGRRSVARIRSTEDVWEERTVELGGERLGIDPSSTYECQVWGEPRGPEPIVVVADSWTYVLLR